MEYFEQAGQAAMKKRKTPQLYFPLMEYFEQEGKAGGHGDEKGPRSQLYLPLMVYSELTRALLSIDGLFQARAFDCQYIRNSHHPVKQSCNK